MPDESILREQARAVIQAGKVPSRRPDRTWGGPGVGARCAICEKPVGRDELESEAKLRAILGRSPTILCVTGLADGRIREVNDTFLRTTGYSREEILGRTATELGLWLDPDQEDQGMRSLRAGKPIHNVEARFRMKNGEERVTVLAA